MCKNLFCENPVWIVNPLFKVEVLHNKWYRVGLATHFLSEPECDDIYLNKDFSKFSPKKYKNSVGFPDDFYTFSKSSGLLTPMFIQVPCGKCELCRAKKSAEWSFRALCENCTSCSRPLFITLTYDNKHIPENGVNIRDYQLFLKRLRINLQRAGFDSNLRYFICAEYGSHTYRPHYHIIFWNYPVMTTVKAELDLINKSWKNGFVYGGSLKRGAISYVMKYMRKPQIVPKGMNDTFFRSSRKDGGIGYSYAMKHIEEYRSNPQMCDMTVVDPYSGITLTSKLPKYFKEKFFPSKSQIFKQKFCKALKILDATLIKLLSIYKACGTFWHIDSGTLDMSLMLRNKYSSYYGYPLRPNECIISDIKSFNKPLECLYDFDRLQSDLLECDRVLENVCTILLTCPVDANDFDELIELHNKHSLVLEKLMSHIELDVNECKRKIVKQNNDMKLRETF